MAHSAMLSTRVKKHYEIKECLGSGTFSKVYLGIHKKTNEKFAIKVIEKKLVEYQRLQTEIAILKNS